MDIVKKRIVIVIVVTVLCALGSFIAYNHFTESKDDYSGENEPEVVFKDTFKDNLPRLDASLATQPLMDEFVKYFAGKDSLSSVKENYTNTHPAYVELIDGKKDLIVVTEPSEEELKLASDKNVLLEVTKLVNESFVFYVNKDNKVDGLTLEQIQNIYSGKITNWKDVGGEDKEILAYQRPVNSGSQTGMISLVMKDIPLKKPRTVEMIESMGGIIDAVASYDNASAGIGYSYYYYANTMYSSPDIKFLKVDGVLPTYESTKDESYPIRTAYYLVTRKDADEKTLKFKEALLSKEGSSVIRGAGYVSTN